jgi:two-component system, OmpR family, response regulator RegX3
VSGRVLIAEDETAIAESVAYAFRGEGFEVDTVDDGESALAAARADGYDVLVLDLMLPGLSGLEVCRRLRAESAIPIVMLTARIAEVDRVVGLDAGADDYVVKPFSMPELLSRVRALLRRRDLDRAEPSVLAVGTLVVDPGRHSVTVDGEPVRLTPSEFKLLALLARNPERAFSRRELMRHLWDSAYVGDQRAGDAHIVNLRRKIGRDRLVTVRGVGYKLVAV